MRTAIAFYLFGSGLAPQLPPCTTLSTHRPVCTFLRAHSRKTLTIHSRSAQTHAITDAFTVGGAVMIAPVLEEGATSRSVYFPGKQPWYVFCTVPVLCFVAFVSLQPAVFCAHCHPAHPSVSCSLVPGSPRMRSAQGQGSIRVHAYNPMLALIDPSSPTRVRLGTTGAPVPRSARAALRSPPTLTSPRPRRSSPCTSRPAT